MIKNKKRAFTLIELLAVIIILAVIALIATPIVLNVVDESRKKAAQLSTTSYVKAIESKILYSSLENVKYEDKENYAYDEIKVDMQGTIPTEGIYSLKNGIVESGTFCINGYMVNYTNSTSQVVDKGCNVEDLKLAGSIKLSSSNGNYTYPEIGTFEVIENISGGELSCTSSDESVATCSISGTTVTVVSGTTEGSSTLIITSKATGVYKEAKAVYVVTTTKGLMSVTANGYSGVYDGQPHGITVVSENSIIKYGTIEGIYDLETNPTYTNVGTYTVYYQVSKSGYNTVTGSKDVVITKAEGSIKLEQQEGNVEYDNTNEVKILENISNGEITLEVANTDIVEASIENDKLVLKGKQVGITTVTVTSNETTNYNSASTSYTVTVTKANNTLTLSSNSGSYIYPTSGTFEITANTSGGELSCISSDESVATCSINGTTVTVTPGTTEGSSTITIKSAATTNYNESQVAYVATTSHGLLSYTATGYTGMYDGSAHGITVTSSGATITYSTDETNYSSTNPTYANVGTYTVYYQISKVGYNTITGSKDVVINKAEGSVTAPTAKTLTYTGNAQNLINAGSSSTGTIQYKLNDGSYTESIPTATNAGTYTVYYKVVGDSNHNDVAEASITVTIAKATLSYTANGYSGTYDGASHGITVISEGATITYSTDGTSYSSTSPTYIDVGTYTVYFKITREGYIDVESSKTVTITKANNTLTLSSNSGSYTYPTSGTFTVTDNTSGGTLSCTSSNTSVATCSISGTTVTVTPGTTAGAATITIKSVATTNYNEAQAAYTATTISGTLSVTANGYSGTYDGKAHGITVTSSGATIKYGTSSGTYNSTSSPKYTNAGTYTVYYQVSKAGYKTVTGSKKVVINKASGSVTLSSTSGTVYTGKTTTFTVSGATGTLSCSTSNSSIATCSVSGTTVTVNGIGVGKATLTVNVAASTNYNTTSKTYSVVVNLSTCYAFGLPDTSSSTNFQDVITSSGSNAFIQKEGEQLSVCIYRNNTLECFKNNSYDEESTHLQNVFGANSCNLRGPKMHCFDVDFHCIFDFDGDVHCSATASGHECNVDADGDVYCY